MASLYRLSTRARQQAEEAVVSTDELRREILDGIADGVLTQEEIRRIIHRMTQLDREVKEALVAAAENDVEDALHNYRSKAGFDAPLNFYLREKIADLQRLKAELAEHTPTQAIPAQAGGSSGGKKRTGLTLIRQASGSTRLVRRG